MALFHANHPLTQGSLHYPLATQGYQKRNTDGVETFILYYCERQGTHEWIPNYTNKLYKIIRFVYHFINAYAQI